MSIIFNNVRVPMSGTFFPGQKVLIEKGKIASVGSVIRKNVDTVIECDQKYLVAGLIDAHTHLGLFENGTAADDMCEKYTDILPHLRPLDGIKMRDRAIEDARRAGVSACMVCPASEMAIAGLCSILKMNGKSADVGLIIEQAGVLMNFGRNVKTTAKQNKAAPTTRMGISALIREALMKAEDYQAARQNKKLIKDRDIALEALLPLLRGEVPMRACADTADEIMAAVRIAEEFKLKLVIEHASEAHLVAPALAEKKIPVVLGPILVPNIRHELTERSFESAKALIDAGVEVALSCDYPGLPIETLRIAAAMAVQYGLDEKRALAAITEVPANILGLGNRCGTIKKGFDGDVALFSGHPLDIRSRLEVLVVDGDLFVYSDDIQIETEQ